MPWPRARFCLWFSASTRVLSIPQDFLRFRDCSPRMSRATSSRLGASLVLGTSGALAKLLALPVFCIVVIASRWFGTLLSHRAKHPFVPLLVIKVLLLAGGVRRSRSTSAPFHNGDAWQAILTGMVLVAAMAIQNAVHRVHLASFPPSTLMTGTTTQIMLDIADRIYPRAGAAAPSSRLIQMSIQRRRVCDRGAAWLRCSMQGLASGALSCRRWSRWCRWSFG